MRRLFILLIVFTLPLAVSAKEYINTAVKINLEKGIILGVMEKKSGQEVFQFPLKNSDYNDGKTFVIYRNWLPDVPEGFGLRMHISPPEGFMVVTESNRYKETATGTLYEFDNPEQGVALALSDQWMKKTVEYKGVDISTFFTEKNRRFSEAYFERIKELLDMYTVKLGAYPYGSFNVVDVPYPAGHALKSLTFISSGIIGMPFLTDVSLGHELVHQWLGIAVDADTQEGNWAEALTTFYADRLYKELDGEDADYRKNALQSYMAYARQKEGGTCLMDFQYNKGKSSQAVGYAKGMMVFTMLETILGREDFDKSVRIFIERYSGKKAVWSDLTDIMESLSGVSLEGFMDGWLTETALAEFSISSVKVNGALSGYTVKFDIGNKHDWLEYPLEILVRTDKGDVRDYLYVDSEKESVEIKTEGRPLEIIFDPEYKTARLLSQGETAPVLHYLFSKYGKTVFVNPEEKEKYEEFISTLEDAEVVSDDANPSMYMDRILIFAGENNRAYEKLYKRKASAFDGQFMIKSEKHPMGTDRMTYLIYGADKKTVDDNVRRISHYGKYSALYLKDGRRYEKVTEDADKGLRVLLNNENQGVAVQKPLSIKDIVNANSDTKVFLIGEKHDEFSHHENQYQLIKTLHEQGRDIAVGLEMVQKPYQKYLDAYIKGEIDEKEMLAGTEYFTRWRFDYRLYRKIFEYARENSIPLVALNLEREITKAVSAGGIRSLSEEELAKIPSDIEYTGGHYKERLSKIFHMHESRRSFDNFYEAQLLWDETMAQSAYDYMLANPEKIMVVVAGNGHVEYGYGIADRIKRRSGEEYIAIVQDQDYEYGVADYILYPDEMEYEASPKLGVMVEDKEDGLFVSKVMDDSKAGEAGVEADDYITGFDGAEITRLSDIKLALTFAEKGKEYSLKVKRGDETVSLTITF